MGTPCLGAHLEIAHREEIKEETEKNAHWFLHNRQ